MKKYDILFCIFSLAFDCNGLIAGHHNGAKDLLNEKTQKNEKKSQGIKKVPYVCNSEKIKKFKNDIEKQDYIKKLATRLRSMAIRGAAFEIETVLEKIAGQNLLNVDTTVLDSTFQLASEFGHDSVIVAFLHNAKILNVMNSNSFSKTFCCEVENKNWALAALFLEKASGLICSSGIRFALMSAVQEGRTNIVHMILSNCLVKLAPSKTLGNTLDTAFKGAVCRQDLDIINEFSSKKVVALMSKETFSDSLFFAQKENMKKKIQELSMLKKGESLSGCFISLSINEK